MPTTAGEPPGAGVALLNAEEIGAAKYSEISRARRSEIQAVVRYVGCTVCAYLLLAGLLCAALPSSPGVRHTEAFGFDAQMHLYGLVGFLTFGSLQWIGAALSADEGLAQAALIPSGMAVIGSVCYFLHGFHLAPAWRTPTEPDVIAYPVRNLSWMGTTSLIVYAIWQSTGLPIKELVTAELMTLLSFSIATVSQMQSRTEFLYLGFAIYAVTFGASVVNKWRMLDVTISLCDDNQRAQGSIRLLRLLTASVWLAFPLNYLLQHLKVIPPTTMEVVFVVIDILAKCILAGASAQGAMRTLSDRRHAKLQEMSVSMVDQLRDHDKRKDRFFAAMTHELRTPLNGIIGLTDSLLYSERDVMSAKCRAALTTVRDTGKRFHKLINNILDNASLEEKKLNLVLQPISVHQLVEEVAMLITPILNPNVKLVLALPEELPLVQGDFNRLVQVVFNLLGNAAKFTEKGTITVRARVENGNILVDFMDTGIGIPSDKLDLIFLPFEQVDMSKSRAHGGTGLGLSLAKRLVESHGGKLIVESEIGEGTCFTMSISVGNSTTSSHAAATIDAPMAATTAAPAPAKRSHVHRPLNKSLSIASSCVSANEQVAERNNLLQWISDRSSEIHSQDATNSGPIEILSVDDDPVNQAVITDLLSGSTMQVTVAMDAREALNLLEDRFQDKGTEGFPSLILMDQMMPNMTGLEATEIIRERYPLCAVPIIMVSANNDEHSICKALENGCNDYITKPFQRTELLARVGLQMRMLNFYLQQVKGVQSESHMVDLLPQSVIRRLKSGEINITDTLQSMTTMHAEVSNLKELAASCKPSILIGMLNKLTVTLEAISKKHGVFKRPIDGGHFRVISGHDGSSLKDHALRVLKVTADFMEACGSLTVAGKPLKIKAGVSTGRAIGGITGNHPPQYVIVGESTAHAILMAREAYPGCAFVSEQTHSLLSPEALAEVFFCDLGDRVVGAGVEQTWMLQVADWEAGLQQAYNSCRSFVDRRRSTSHRMSNLDAMEALPGVVRVDNFARLSIDELSKCTPEELLKASEVPVGRPPLPTASQAQEVANTLAEAPGRAASGRSLDDLYELLSSLVAQNTSSKSESCQPPDGLAEIADSVLTMAKAMDGVNENIFSVRKQLQGQDAQADRLEELVTTVAVKLDEVGTTCEAIDTHLAEKADAEAEMKEAASHRSAPAGSHRAAQEGDDPLELILELKESIDRLEECTGDLSLIREEQEAKLAADEHTMGKKSQELQELYEAVAELGPSVELCYENITQHREDTRELRKSVLSAISSIEISTPAVSEVNHALPAREISTPATPVDQKAAAPEHDDVSAQSSITEEGGEGGEEDVPAPVDPEAELVELLNRHGKQRYSKVLLANKATVPILRNLKSASELQPYGISSPSAQRFILKAVQSDQQ